MPTSAYVNMSSRQASKDDDPLHISMPIIIHVIVEPTTEQLRFPVHKALESRRQVRTRLQAAAGVQSLATAPRRKQEGVRGRTALTSSAVDDFH